MWLLLLACDDAPSDVRTAPHDTGDPEDTVRDTDLADTDAPDPPADTDTDTGNGANPEGIDVSHWDGAIDWEAAAADDIAFAWIKATQGTGFRDPEFATYYADAADAGVYRGAYHFAEPDSSDGASQADFFVENGGGWVDDGITLPGALDIEWNPYGDDCYDLTKSEMQAWIHDFVDQYAARTGRLPVIYCGATWWAECVGSTDLSDVPLWVASWDRDAPILPNGWSEHTIWQYGAGEVAGIDVEADVDLFNGSRAKLRHLAAGR